MHSNTRFKYIMLKFHAISNKSKIFIIIIVIIIVIIFIIISSSSSIYLFYFFKPSKHCIITFYPFTTINDKLSCSIDYQTLSNNFL